MGKRADLKKLNDLLGLKQQQMGVVEARLEAREAVEQGRETIRQGRTIMLFTVVTIIFVSHSNPFSRSNCLFNRANTSNRCRCHLSRVFLV